MVAFSRLDRKVALVRLGLSNEQIAKDLGVHSSLVSHVIAGRRWTGPEGRRVMQYVAERLGLPLEVVFPGSDRRGGGGGRRGSDLSSEAA